MTKRRTFSAKFKAQVVLEVLTGVKTSAQVCREHQIKESVLSRWKQGFIERAPELFERSQRQGHQEERIAECNYSSRTLKANRYLRTALVQAAHAAGRSRDTYLGEKYRRMARRRGKKRAAVAVARTILVIAYHMIREGTTYIERGATYFDQLKPQSTQQWLTRRLECLDFKVTLEPIVAA